MPPKKTIGKKFDTLGRIASPGRPLKPVDKEQIYKLAQLWCTMEEISAHIGVSVDTLERQYADIIKKGKEEGKASLRRMQWRSALDGNVTMQIWLGKNILKQTDTQPENNVSETTINKFDELMGQLNALQSASKMATNSINKEQKS